FGSQNQMSCLALSRPRSPAPWRNSTSGYFRPGSVAAGLSSRYGRVFPAGFLNTRASGSAAVLEQAETANAAMARTRFMGDSQVQPGQIEGHPCGAPGDPGWRPMISP